MGFLKKKNASSTDSPMLGKSGAPSSSDDVHRAVPLQKSASKKRSFRVRKSRSRVVLVDADDDTTNNNKKAAASAAPSSAPLSLLETLKIDTMNLMDHDEECGETGFEIVTPESVKAAELAAAAVVTQTKETQRTLVDLDTTVDTQDITSEDAAAVGTSSNDVHEVRSDTSGSTQSSNHHDHQKSEETDSRKQKNEQGSDSSSGSGSNDDSGSSLGGLAKNDLAPSSAANDARSEQDKMFSGSPIPEQMSPLRQFNGGEQKENDSLLPEGNAGDQPSMHLPESPIRVVDDSVMSMDARSQPSSHDDSFRSNATGPGGNLLKVFACGGRNDPITAGCQDKIFTMAAVGERPRKVMDLFYDKLCTPQDFDRNTNRVMFDEDFVQQFIQEMFRGITLLVLQAPNTEGNHSYDWKGRSVAMRLEPGQVAASGGSAPDDLQPKLSWTILPGGQHFTAITMSVSLLRIQSIVTSAADGTGNNHNNIMEDEQQHNLSFFTITTDDGQVHVFEAATPEQRDYIVAGLRNIIARLSFHLVAGDTGASSELYSQSLSNGEVTGELPSLVHPTQTMNRLTHAMLD